MPNASLSVREATMQDWEAMVRLEEACFSDAWSKELIADEIHHPSTYVCIAEWEGEIVGFAYLWFGFAEAHITNFAVASIHRRKGFASLLMKHIIQKAIEEKAQAMTLEVRVSNGEAKALYGKFGFESVGVRPHYYGDGEDAEMMWKYDLNEACIAP